MKNLEIIYYPSSQEVKQMVELDAKAYDNALDRGQYEKCLNWMNICPDLYTAIKIKTKIVGYVNLIPVTKKCFDLFKSGKIKDNEIPLNDFKPFKRGRNYCIFMSLVVKKNFQHENVLLILLKALKDRIKNMKEKNIIIESVVCDAVNTKIGNFVTKVVDAKYICSTPTGSKIYEFKL